MSEPALIVIVYVTLFLAIFGMLMLVLALPAIIAFRRQHPNRWLILAVCLFLGATGIGWAVALVWALNAAHRPTSGEGSMGGESGLNIFANDVKRVVFDDDRGAANGRPDASPVDDVLQQIERLEKLRAAGQINDTEFATLKAAAIGRL